MDPGNMAEIVTAAVTGAAVVVAYRAINAKRSDDRRADRLNRINRQLSELYGKLSILNEAGIRNWYSFVLQYSNDNTGLGREFMRFFPYKPKADEPITAFNPAPPTAKQLEAYRQWLKVLFMKTNEEMLEVIYANADLVVGKTMPSVFIVFAEHVASLRLLLLKLEDKEKEGDTVFLSNWEEYTKLMAPHPSGGLGLYIQASFEVLKEEQERMLSTHDVPLTEKKLANKIEWVKWREEDYWCKQEHKVRASVGQHYDYKEVPKPSGERT
ncbi:hypothetical protein [Hymenobacter sp. AT01-02]|uniref:hypothetical protein n=1 Tax=Hymenobacter sp. AT01-02 TaxID=1571877 RepID=UPI0005F12E11|nr:hypothetical protein [Hymenobacter sp. AT01-02]